MTDKLRTGNPIWVYYRNQDEAYNIQPPKLLQGYYGESYHIEIPRFPRHQFISASDNLEGQFDDQARQIYLYYRNANWQSNEVASNYLIASKPIQLYDRPQGLPIDNQLPNDIIFECFRKVITTDRHHWYQVTAERWLEFDPESMQLLDDNPYTDHVEPTTETDFDDQMQILFFKSSFCPRGFHFLINKFLAMTMFTVKNSINLLMERRSPFYAN